MSARSHNLSKVIHTLGIPKSPLLKNFLGVLRPAQDERKQIKMIHKIRSC